MLAKVFFVSKYIEILKIVRACLKSLNFIMSNKCKKAIYSCVFVCTHIYANKESHHLVSLSNCIHISLNFLYCKKMNNLSPFSFPLFVICCSIELVLTAFLKMNLNLLFLWPLAAVVSILHHFGFYCWIGIFWTCAAIFIHLLWSNSFPYVTGSFCCIMVNIKLIKKIVTFEKILMIQH